MIGTVEPMVVLGTMHKTKAKTTRYLFNGQRQNEKRVPLNTKMKNESSDKQAPIAIHEDSQQRAQDLSRNTSFIFVKLMICFNKGKILDQVEIF